jgi:hypothetical protein
LVVVGDVIDVAGILTAAITAVLVSFGYGWYREEVEAQRLRRLLYIEMVSFELNETVDEFRLYNKVVDDVMRRKRVPRSKVPRDEEYGELVASLERTFGNYTEVAYETPVYRSVLDRVGLLSGEELSAVAAFYIGLAHVRGTIRNPGALAHTLNPIETIGFDLVETARARERALRAVRRGYGRQLIPLSGRETDWERSGLSDAELSRDFDYFDRRHKQVEALLDSARHGRVHPATASTEQLELAAFG